MIKKLAIVSLVSLLLSAAVSSWATESQGTPAAKAEFEKGNAASTKGDYSQAVEYYRKAIELDPDFVEAHFRFIRMSMQADKKHEIDAVTERLRKLYQGWAEKSNKAVYEWALGYLNYKTPVKSVEYYRKAITMDPNFARPYYELAQLAVYRGENQEYLRDLKRAAEINPDNPDYGSEYASALSKSNPAEARKLFLQIVARFPKENAGADALYTLAYHTEKIDEKIAILERLKTEFPPERFSSSAMGSQQLFELYSHSNSAKALLLAQQMVKEMPEAKQKAWRTFATYQQNVIDARKLLKEKRFKEALAMLEATPKPPYTPEMATTSMEAEAEDGMGETAKAYDRISKIDVKAPTDALNADLLKFGTKLGKTPQQVDNEVWRMREAKATAAPDFALPRCTDNKIVRLSDYRGTVVLLNFFFPG